MAVMLSEKAAKEVKRILDEQKFEADTLLRVGVDGGGCSGFQYSLGFDKNYDAKIDSKLVQCISGTEEDDDPCPTLKSSGVESIAIDGGHHFDGDYEALADRIVNGLKARLGAP